jgi:hypothetical protein
MGVHEVFLRGNIDCSQPFRVKSETFPITPQEAVPNEAHADRRSPKTAIRKTDIPLRDFQKIIIS